MANASRTRIPRGIPLDGRVHESLHAGEFDYGVELPLDLRLRHAENRAVQEDVLASGELGVEARADLEQATYAAVQLYPSLRGHGDPGKDLQQRALACAVLAHQPDHLPCPDAEIDVPQGPDTVPVTASRAGLLTYLPRLIVVSGAMPPALKVFPQRTGSDQTQPILLGYVFDVNHAHARSRTRLDRVHEVAFDPIEEQDAADQDHDGEDDAVGQDGRRLTVPAPRKPNRKASTSEDIGFNRTSSR